MLTEYHRVGRVGRDLKDLVVPSPLCIYKVFPEIAGKIFHTWYKQHSPFCNIITDKQVPEARQLQNIMSFLNSQNTHRLPGREGTAGRTLFFTSVIQTRTSANRVFPIS